MYNTSDGSGVRNTGDVYLEYDITIAGEAITHDPGTYDWSIFLDTSSEYIGWTSESLWPLIPESLRIKDADILQIKINGDDRGQFQRYIMSISRLMSLVIGKQVNAKKSHGFSGTNAEFLFRELESRGLPFSSDWITSRQQIVFEDSVYHNKYAGVFTAIRAIAIRFFGWLITAKAFDSDNVFVLNNENSVLFYDDITPTADPGNAGEDSLFITLATASGGYTGTTDAFYTAEVISADTTAWDGTAEISITGTGGDTFGPTSYYPSDGVPLAIGTDTLEITITDAGTAGCDQGDIWTWTAKRLKPLYDPDLHSDLSGATYTVDVQTDANFTTKQPDFERLLSGFVPSGFTITWDYINLP